MLLLFIDLAKLHRDDGEDGREVAVVRQAIPRLRTIAGCVCFVLVQHITAKREK